MRSIAKFICPIFLVSALTTILPAQDEDVIFIDQPPSSAETATVKSRIRDLDSDSAEIRRAAVLILGKYQRPDAIASLIRMLGDPAADVRRAALVSLVENLSVPQSAAIPILDMLADEDIHVRRIASAAIPNVAFMIESMRFDQKSGKIVRQDMPEKTRAAILGAYRDADAGVRKNMLAGHPYLQSYAPAEALSPLLDDPDRDVKLCAIDRIFRLLSPGKRKEAAAKLAQDKDDLVKLKLLKTLRTCPKDPALMKILEQFCASPSPEIRSEALLCSVYWGVKPDLAVLEKAIFDPELTSDLKKDFISLLSIYSAEAKPLLKKIIAESEISLKAQALDILLAIGADSISDAERLDYLESPIPELRAASLRHLSQMARLDKELLGKICASKYPELRLKSAQLSASMPEENAKKILDELILDDDDEVRSAALQSYARRRIPGWIQLLRQTLEDENPRISETAFDELLMAREKDAERALDDFASKNPDNPLAGKIRGRPTEQRVPQIFLPGQRKR